MLVCGSACVNGVRLPARDCVLACLLALVDGCARSCVRVTRDLHTALGSCAQFYECVRGEAIAFVLSGACGRAGVCVRACAWHCVRACAGGRVCTRARPLLSHGSSVSDGN